MLNKLNLSYSADVHCALLGVVFVKRTMHSSVILRKSRTNENPRPAPSARRDLRIMRVSPVNPNLFSWVVSKRMPR